jgi:hypothetical protein
MHLSVFKLNQLTDFFFSQNRSCYSYDAEGIFQEKVEERDSYENKWRTQRPIIKEILKKRQKNAAKNQKRRSTRDLK